MNPRNDRAWQRLLGSLIAGLGLALALIWLAASLRIPGAQAASVPSPATAGGISEAMAGLAGAEGNRLLALSDVTPDWSAAGGGGSDFGRSVASAGDVNGDGYADLAVGAPTYGGAPARTYVYHGGSGGLSASPAFTATGAGMNNRLGVSVASAGDVNGDGYADLVVGASGYNLNTGQAYVYHGGSGGLGPTPVLTLTGQATGNSFGQSVASAGDVNGDGYADLVVGAIGYDVGRGRVYVYHGGAGGLSATPVLTLSGESVGDSFGKSVASAGDVNGDGYADLIVGAHDYNQRIGRAYVYYGGAGGLNGTPALTLDGEGPEHLFGFSVASAGDVNGDGYADVVVGADGYGGNTGRAYLYQGGADGLSDIPARTLTGQGTVLFGRSVASARDVNGDGYADVVVGAPGYNQGTGQAYVYQGGVSGLSATPAFTLTGAGAWSDFGFSVASAGDVNGDGYADLAVGAPATGGLTLPWAYIYHSGAGAPGASPVFTATGRAEGDELGSSVAGAGDVNGDGYADVLIAAPRVSNDRGLVYLHLGEGAGLSASPAFSATGRAENDRLGWSVAGAGDVNGDSYADVLVGAPGVDAGGARKGQATLYLGGGAGLGVSAAFTATGRSDQDFLGWSVAGVGDVNGDGYADVLLGAPGADAGSAEKGQAYLYLGEGGGLSATPAFTATGLADYDSLGYSVAGAGDVNGDGYADVLVGAPEAGSGGQVYLYLGGGGGLNPTQALTLTGQGTGYYFGGSVASAGDVNGDGYADVLVGAPWAGPDLSVGRVYLYLGSSAGLSAGPAFTATGVLGASLGYSGSVAGAGDVNGDGYADALLGAPFIDVPGPGQAYLYYGGAIGLSATPAFTASGQADTDELGRSVAGVGDVNGDGFADVVFGAPGAGQAYLHLGNGAGGRHVLARQVRGVGEDVPVQPWGLSNAQNAFYLRLAGTDPMGRGRVKLQAQACPPGVPFGDAACLDHTSGAWTDVTASSAGVTLEATVSGLASGELYRWRARVVCAPLHVTQAGITPPPNPAHGPWRRFLGQAFEADLRAGRESGGLYLPLIVQE